MEIEEMLIDITDKLASELVVCDISNKIVYMNRSAKERYKQYVDIDLVGHDLMAFINEEARSRLEMVVEWFKEDEANNRIFAYHDDEFDCDCYLNSLRDKDGRLVGYYGVRERRGRETVPQYQFD